MHFCERLILCIFWNIIIFFLISYKIKYYSNIYSEGTEKSGNICGRMGQKVSSQWGHWWVGELVTRCNRYTIFHFNIFFPGHIFLSYSPRKYNAYWSSFFFNVFFYSPATVLCPGPREALKRFSTTREICSFFFLNGSD